MALQNLLGDLALDVTLQDILDVLGTKDRPLIVATADGGFPVVVRGEVTPTRIPVRARMTSIDATSSSIAWKKVLDVNTARRSLSIYNVYTSAAYLNVTLDDDAAMRDGLQGSGHTSICIAPGDEWTCPIIDYVGPVYASWATASAIVLGRITEWVVV